MKVTIFIDTLSREAQNDARSHERHTTLAYERAALDGATL
jgi:hypothetical protein